MGLADDILAAAWSVFETLPDSHPLRLDFMSALWCLEDALDGGGRLDAALVAVVQFVGVVAS